MPTKQNRSPEQSRSPGDGRGDRRRHATRRRLLEATRSLIAEQGVGAMRTSEITERADVGAGSFYNHFSDKDAIVEALLAEIADEQGRLVDDLGRDLDDPAEVVSLSHRHFVGLATSDPTFGNLVIRLHSSHRLLQGSLGPRALRDIMEGVESGRFEVADAAAAVYATGGALIGTISGVVDGALGEGAAEEHAALVLRMLGLDPQEAERISVLAT